MFSLQLHRLYAKEMISVDHEEIPIGLMNCISTNVELKVIKNVLDVNYDKVQQSKTALREEYKKLVTNSYIGDFIT